MEAPTPVTRTRTQNSAGLFNILHYYEVTNRLLVRQFFVGMLECEEFSECGIGVL